jgi:hypothetical protein
LLRSLLVSHHFICGVKPCRLTTTLQIHPSLTFKVVSVSGGRSACLSKKYMDEPEVHPSGWTRYPRRVILREEEKGDQDAAFETEIFRGV